jgi:hypothetical protein
VSVQENARKNRSTLHFFRRCGVSCTSILQASPPDNEQFAG